MTRGRCNGMEEQQLHRHVSDIHGFPRAVAMQLLYPQSRDDSPYAGPEATTHQNGSYSSEKAVGISFFFKQGSCSCKVSERCPVSFSREATTAFRVLCNCLRTGPANRLHFLCRLGMFLTLFQFRRRLVYRIVQHSVQNNCLLRTRSVFRARKCTYVNSMGIFRQPCAQLCTGDIAASLPSSQCPLPHALLNDATPLYFHNDMITCPNSFIFAGWRLRDCAGTGALPGVLVLIGFHRPNPFC
jgi:hypothetical protein